MSGLLILILALALLVSTAQGDIQFWLSLLGLGQRPVPPCQGYPYPCNNDPEIIN